MSTLSIVGTASLFLRGSLTIRCKLASQKANLCKVQDGRSVRVFSEFRGIRRSVWGPTVSANSVATRRCLCSRGRGSRSSESDIEHSKVEVNHEGLIRVGVAGLVPPGTPIGDSNIVQMCSWPFELPSPFGKLSIDQTSFPVRILPADVHEYPAGDRVFVRLLASVPKGLSAQFELASFQKIISNIRCSLQGENVTLSHDSVDDAPLLSWLIEVPTCYDIQVSSKSEGHISIENLENEQCSVQTENGNISLRSLKSAHLKVHSAGGHIMCSKALQGSGILETQRKGMISADKLQGLDFTVLTESGPVHIKDIYARRSKVCSRTGPITVGNLHTNCSIATSSNVDTGSVEGFMSVNLSGAGEFRGYLSRHESVDIRTERGNIDIRLPGECRTKVNLTGRGVEVDSSLVFYSSQPSDGQKKIGELNGGGEGSVITASSEEGIITVKTLSWFDSLGLAKSEG